MDRIVKVIREKKFVASLAAYQVSIDNKIVGWLENDSAISISVDEFPHVLGVALRDIRKTEANIPAGTDGYIFSMSLETLQGIPHLQLTGKIPTAEMANLTAEVTFDEFKDYTAFKDNLVAFMIKIFNGQGIQDRLQSENNSNHNIYIVIQPNGISLEYTPVRTQGLLQWATGRISEKIYYKEIGLELPSKLPEHWSKMLLREIIQGILSSNSDFIYDSLGGIRKTKMHPLY